MEMSHLAYILDISHNLNKRRFFFYILFSFLFILGISFFERYSTTAVLCDRAMGKAFYSFWFHCSFGQSSTRIKPDVHMVDQHRTKFIVWRGEQRSSAPLFALADPRTRGARTPAQRWRPLLSQTVPRSLSGR